MKNLTKLITVFIFVIQISFNTYATDKPYNNLYNDKYQSTILLPSVHVPNIEFLAHLEVNKNSLLSFSEHYLSSRPFTQNVSELIDIFERAQTFYFSQNYLQAQSLYTKILTMQDIDDWKEIHRRVFMTSFFRLAELDTEKTKDYLIQAAQFAPEININSIEASQTLKNEFKKLIKNKNNIEWNVSGLKNDFPFIVINGRVIDLSKTNKIMLPNGKFRITFLSNYYKPQVFNVSAQQAALLVPVKVAFVNGTCDNPIVNNDGDITANYDVMFSKSCEKPKKTLLAPNYNKLPDTQSIYKSVEKPFYKKPWFVVAVAAFATGVVIYAVQKNKREGSTTETSREVIP